MDLNSLHDKLSMSEVLCFICLTTERHSLWSINALAFASQKPLIEILVSIYNPAANIVMDDITITKTLNTHDSG